MLGFDIEPWLLAMRGQTLVLLGLGKEAKEFLDKVIALEPSQVDVTNHLLPSLAYVEWGWATRTSALRRSTQRVPCGCRIKPETLPQCLRTLVARTGACDGEPNS